MLKNIVLSFILICLIFTISFAQEFAYVEIYELEGWVKYENKKSASGVTMSIGQYNIFTDQNGYYKITFLDVGKHLIFISPPGKERHSVWVSIKGNDPYQIDSNLNILNIKGGPLLLDESRSSIAITSKGINLYQMRKGGTILRYTGTGRNWEQLDNTPDNYGILFDNNILYKIRRNGEIWQYALTRGWNRLDHDPSTCAFFTDFIPERNIVIVRKDFLINW